MNRTFWSIACLAIACSGCGSSDSSGGSAHLKQSIDLTGVIGFAIGDAASTSSAYSVTSPLRLQAGPPSGQSLYAVSADGTMTITSVTDSGSSDTTEHALAVHDTKLYELFAYSGVTDANGGPCDTVILRKSDGALFCGLFTTQNVQVLTDATGEQLDIVGPGTVIRVDMTNPEQPTQTEVFQTLGIRHALVNAAGDALLAFNDGSSDGLRIYKQAGGLQNFSIDNVRCMTRGLTGQVNDFYYIDPQISAGTSPINHITRNGDGSYNQTQLAALSNPAALDDCQFALATSDRIFVARVSLTSQATTSILELVNASATPVEHTISGISKITEVLGHGQSIFVRATDSSGNGTILRVDAGTFAQTTLLPAGDFSLSAISLSANGDLTFSGLRNADGKHVLGNVPAGADTYAILSETAPTVSTAQRIN